MSILKATTITTGLVDAGVSFVYINTNDTFNEVSVVGYLNSIVDTGTNLSTNQMALVNTSDLGAQLFKIHISNGVYSLVTTGEPTIEVVTAATVQMQVNHRYLALKNGGTQVFSLPANPSIGDTLSLYGGRTCAWSIDARGPLPGPFIAVGSTIFTNVFVDSGASQGNCVELVCVSTAATYGGWVCIYDTPAALASH